MLDLFSAIDTINHYILINRQQHSVDITDAALSWLHSYITERYQRVAVDSATSADCVMKCGVPQGSVLGPILYCIYTRPIGDIVARHGLQYHCYADDTQIYMAVKHNQPITEAITKIEKYLAEVTDWYGKNQLKLNTEKSEAVIFLTSKQRDDLPPDISETIGGHRVVPKPSARNLGLILDSGLTMQAQVAQITKSCYHQIRSIRRSGQALLMMRAKPWCTQSSLHASTTRIRRSTAFRRQRCSVCNVCTIALPGSSAARKNTTTSRQCCSICTGYRFVWARRFKCLCLFTR